MLSITRLCKTKISPPLSIDMIKTFCLYTELYRRASVLLSLKMEVYFIPRKGKPTRKVAGNPTSNTVVVCEISQQFLDSKKPPSVISIFLYIPCNMNPGYTNTALKTMLIGICKKMLKKNYEITLVIVAVSWFRLDSMSEFLQAVLVFRHFLLFWSFIAKAAGLVILTSEAINGTKTVLEIRAPSQPWPGWR